MPELKVILPEKGKENILITSALPYVNNVPHLGNIVGSVLSADVFARYCKLRGRPTLFICGTDEYGTTTETKALETGQTPQQLCDEFHKKHKDVYDWFEIDFDYFGRTTTQKQTAIVQEIFKKLHKKDLLEQRTTTQPYCEKHKAFLADRFVEGTCPKCKYGDARGDQCDQCGDLLDPFELIDPKCKVDGATPVPRDTTHIFLLLNKLQPRVEKWFEEAHKQGDWPVNGTSITRSWLDKGLEGRSISRDLKWGVPIPLDGFEEKVFYVWFDACIGYPSITANYTDEWEQWWRNPDDVKLYQFMGKDNVPFHTVIFPASQLGTDDKWTMLNHLSTCEYLNYEDAKFSKSRGVGVFGDTAKETNVPPSVWRYYLMANRPETGDSQFEWSTFVAANNSELLNNFGNFVNRLIKFTNAKLDSQVPEMDLEYKDQNMDEKGALDVPAWVAEINGMLKEYIELLNAVHLRAGLKKFMEISSHGNLLLQFRLDNASLTNNPVKTKTVVALALNLSLLLASLCSPYMPTAATSIVKQLNTEPIDIPDVWNPKKLGPGHKIGKAEYLFTKIDDAKVAEWKDKFGGTQASRLAAAEAKKKKAEEKEKKKAKKAAAKAGMVESDATATTAKSSKEEQQQPQKAQECTDDGEKNELAHEKETEHDVDGKPLTDDSKPRSKSSSKPKYEEFPSVPRPGEKRELPLRTKPSNMFPE